VPRNPYVLLSGIHLVLQVPLRLEFVDAARQESLPRAICLDGGWDQASGQGVQNL